MPNIKITELPESTSIANDDLLVMVDSGNPYVTKKIAWKNIDAPKDDATYGRKNGSWINIGSIIPTVSDIGTVQGSINSDALSAQIFNMVIDGAVTLNNPTNATDGVSLRWRITQDSNGNRPITLGTKFNLPSSSTPLAWSTTPNTTDLLAATYDAGRDKWDIVAFVAGY